MTTARQSTVTVVACAGFADAGGAVPAERVLADLGAVVVRSGGSLQAVFESAAAAVEAAAALRRRTPFRSSLRIGVATGDGTRGAGGWAGRPFDEATALADGAEAGAIVVSVVTHALAGGDIDATFRAMDVGGTPAFALDVGDEASSALRVVVADDAMLLREGLARLLVEEGFVVVSQCGDAGSLLEAVDEYTPDLAIVDIRMPPTHTTEGIEAAHAIRASHPSTRVVVLSQHVETRHAMGLAGDPHGGFGYLLKDRVADMDEFVDALYRVAAGETVVDPEVVGAMTKRRGLDQPVDRLTARELEVLALMAEGRSNQAIVDRLHLNVKTVETHVRSIFTKLDLEQAPDDHRRVLAVLSYLGR